VNLQTTDYSRESRFLKKCAEDKPWKATMGNGAIIVTSKNMLCLREGVSIEGEVIDYYLQSLEKRSNSCVDNPKRRILAVQYAFGGLFVPAHGLTLEDHYFKFLWKNNSYMWKDVSFLSVHKVYIPWFTKYTNHWSMVVINNLQSRFEHYNSWREDTTDFSKMRVFIGKFVRWQMKIAGRIEETWAWEIYQPRQKKQGKVVPGRVLHEIPGQSGKKMYDCGVFACTYAKYSSEAGCDPVQWNFTHEDVPTLRLMMVRDILCFLDQPRDGSQYSSQCVCVEGECQRARGVNLVKPGVDTADDVD
jgi:Ulp1 family protease